MTPVAMDVAEAFFRGAVTITIADTIDYCEK